LAVAVLPAIARLGFELEDNDFFALAISLDRRHDAGALDDWFACGHFIAIGDKQYPVQLDTATDIYLESLDIYCLAFGYFILLATGFNYRVNMGPRFFP
jgi:hypothetical protein